MKYYTSSLTILLIAAVSICLLSCESKKAGDSIDAPTGNRKSPIAIASVEHDDTYIKVVYGQPYRNGRTIFGDWEPYGEVWRTGANEATEITFTNAVFISGVMVEAGTYALFTIPNEENWTIILNHDLGQWGAFDYSEDRDYARFDVPVISNNMPVEAFTIEFTDVNYSITTMSLSWDEVRVEIPIRFY